MIKDKVVLRHLYFHLKLFNLGIDNKNGQGGC